MAKILLMAEHSFKIHVYPSEPIDVSVGDEAEVTVNGDDYSAVVSSVDAPGAATDIAIKVYMGEGKIFLVLTSHLIK